MMKIIILISTIVSICLLAVLMNTITPVTAGPFGILAIFIFAYILLAGLISYVLHVTSLIVSKLSTAFMPRQPIEALSLRRSYYYSTVVASAPIMLIGLQSVGNVGIYEVLLIVLFVTIGCLYVSKRIK
jgi:hypothetical protein